MGSKSPEEIDWSRCNSQDCQSLDYKAARELQNHSEVPIACRLDKRKFLFVGAGLFSVRAYVKHAAHGDTDDFPCTMSI